MSVKSEVRIGNTWLPSTKTESIVKEFVLTSAWRTSRLHENKPKKQLKQILEPARTSNLLPKITWKGDPMAQTQPAKAAVLTPSQGQMACVC